MSRTLSAFITALVLLTSGSAFAGSFTFTPSPKDLYDLDHYYGYKWGIATPWGKDQKIVSATLCFDDIRDWTVEQNVLYIRLLDACKIGVTEVYDGEASGDLFAGQGIKLKTYYNLPTYAQDLTYKFTDAQLLTLGQYAADGKFGLSFDPDCHFFNNGIKLKVETCKIPTPSVPLPAAALLAFPGTIVAGWARRKLRGDAVVAE